MSVYIREMETPKCCNDCHFRFDVGLGTEVGDGCGLLKEMISNKYERKANCPIVTVVNCDECVYHVDLGYYFCVMHGRCCPNDSEFFCKYGEKSIPGVDAYEMLKKKGTAL